jgi:hypothetical protein
MRNRTQQTKNVYIVVGAPQSAGWRFRAFGIRRAAMARVRVAAIFP